ncbi:hypothetical protein LXL04_039270 [Taraxacum kok-saghyz]
MDSLFGDRITVPPDIGDNSQKFEDVEMKNDNAAESESATDGRSDLHGPIKTGKNEANEKRNSFETKSLRKQRHLKNVEKQKIAKANYDAKMSLKANAESSSNINSSHADVLVNENEEGKNAESKRSKLTKSNSN